VFTGADDGVAVQGGTSLVVTAVALSAGTGTWLPVDGPFLKHGPADTPTANQGDQFT